MLDNDSEIQANTIIYTTIIKGFTKEKNMAMAV
jgi:hypothetical protein